MRNVIYITESFLDNISYGNINNLDLRSDIENANIYGTKLVPQGYVGNRPTDFIGEHEDDTWAIDCYTSDGMEVESYLYTSEFEYNEDIKILLDFCL